MAGPAEWLRLNGQLVAVPSVVCERRPAFDAALSRAAWEALAEPQRDHLRTLLPTFPGDDDGKEQEETLRRLFAGENFRFGNPLDQFFSLLHDGRLTDQIHSLRRLTAETRQRDAKVWQQNYMDNLLRELVTKRKQLLDAAVKTPPDAPITLPPAKKKCRRAVLEQRARKRYFRELELVRAEAGCPADELSPDENYPEGPPPVLSRKQQRHLTKLEATLGGEHVPVAATSSRLMTRGPHLVEHASPEDNPYQVAEARLGQLLKQHRKRRARGQVPAVSARDRQRLDLQSLLKRSSPAGHSTDSDSDTAAVAAPSRAATATVVKKSSTPPPPPPAPPPPPPSTVIAPAPTPTATACWQSAALGQKTHTSFFSLLRDVLCSDPADRLAETSVYSAVTAWQRSPIAALNDWYGRESSWVEALGSALAFLSGEVRELQSQINLVPFLDHVRESGIYQWIGAGRDSDIHLESLCAYWLQRKDTISVKREPSGDGSGPPAALHPTSWTVVPSTPAEKDEYRQQERLRYQAPRRAFTYRLHGYRSTVGPVRSGRDSKAGRGHALLTADRPPGVTLLSLVRDAVARLPNGEGSRADVCELVRDSGFLVAGSGDQPVSAAVSSAMDRLQAEVDPCLRYDSHRKVWMYLHRHRTEAEFETLERQRQASCPRRRQAVKRSAPTPAVSAPGGVSAATVVAVGAAPAGASLLKPRAGALTVAQPKFSAPAPVPPIPPGATPAAAAVSAVLPSEPTTLTQTELAVQSILPAAPPNVPLAPAPASVAVPAPTVLAAAPTAASVAQLQLVSRAAALSPAVAASPPLAAVAGHPPTVQSVKVVKNQHTIVHIPSKTPGAAPQLALLANGKLIPIVNQPATVKAVDGRPRASLMVAPQRPVAAAAARVRPATPAVTVQEAPRRPLLSRPAPVAVAPVASAAIAPQQVVQVSGSTALPAVPAALAPASVASVTLGAPAAATSAAAVTAGSAGGALKHITIPVSQLSRLLQQQAGSGAAGALTLAQIGGRQVLIAARPAAKPPQPQLVQRVQAPTQTVQAMQSVHTVRPAQQVVLQAATHVVPASGVAPTRQISVATSQLQLAAGGAVSAVRPVAAGRPVVLSSATQSPVQLLSGGLRTLHGYKLVQLPASAAATVQARGVSVATAVHQKPVQRPADLLAPLVAATLSSPAVAAVSSATAASPAVTQS